MNLEKLKDTARKYEQKEDWRRAIDVYLKAIQEFESGKEPHPDLSLYNRVGDLYMKVNDPAAAVRSYERAADLYTEQGFLNNAIALCGKILRVNPGRVQTYYKLAQIHARKNMLLEAKRNLIEYLERMNHAGELDAAFDAVKVFADHFPANQEIRFMLIELLRAASREDEARKQVEVVAQELESRGDAVGAQRTREQLEDEAEEVEETRPAAPAAPTGPGGLVFLDTGFAPASPRATTPRSPVVERRAAPPAQVPKPSQPTPMPVQPVEPPLEVAASADLVEDMPLIDLETPEPVDAEVARLDDIIEDVAASPGDVVPDEIDIMLEPAFDSVEDDEAAASGPLEGLEVLTPPEDVEAPDGFVSEEPVPAEELLAGDAAATEGLTGGEEAEGEPLAELETLEEFAVTEEFTEAAAGADDEFFVADEEAEVGEFATEVEAAEDLPELADEFVPAPVDSGMATVDELEGQVLEDPENPELHRRLGEALLLQGETSRASDEFELALSGYELTEQREQAEALVDLLITLHPDSVRYYQKRVEYSYRTGDRNRLLEAYLDLGDALLRMQADDKAAAVYGRVLEHDPDSPRARYGLQQLGLLEEEEVAEEPVEGPQAEPEMVEADADVPPSDTGEFAGTEAVADEMVDDEAMQEALREEAIAAELAIDEALAQTLEAERAAAPPPPAVPAAPPPPEPRPAPRPVATTGDPLGFVDLGSLIIDEEGPRDTRMKGEQLETTGDEQRDFEDMLAQFKKGIDENVGHDDYEAHYDLGIAFKEMGLFDEAIAEFQKALRDPHGRLRTSEALGVAFFEKGQMAVAEAVLRRAVDTLEGGDDQKIGLVYWLGRACEAQGRLPEARQNYERAMAVDIQFMDLRERMTHLGTAQPQ
jgi:tetratricopeptide (TPR) repeat protein